MPCFEPVRVFSIFSSAFLTSLSAECRMLGSKLDMQSFFFALMGLKYSVILFNTLAVLGYFHELNWSKQKKNSEITASLSMANFTGKSSMEYWSALLHLLILRTFKPMESLPPHNNHQFNFNHWKVWLWTVLPSPPPPAASIVCIGLKSN